MFEYKIGDWFKCTHGHDLGFCVFHPGQEVQFYQILGDNVQVLSKDPVGGYCAPIYNPEDFRNHFIPVKL